MSFFQKLSNIDRRIIYALVFVVVILPLIWKSNPEIEISPEVQQAYNSIEKVPAGGIVMVSIDYDGSSEAELQPMLMAVLRHCFSRNIKVIECAQWPLGISLGQVGIESAAVEYGKVYGKDYVNLGYRPGVAALMIGLGKEGFHRYFNRDFRGVEIDKFEIMNQVRNYGQIDRLIGLEAGASGDAWVQYAGAQFGVRIILGVTGVMATSMYPYIQAKQIEGLLGGLKGAAEYETLIKHPHRGVWGMNSQSYLHLLIVLLVIVGNITYYASRSGKPKKSGSGPASPTPNPESRSSF
jgi:hypothetical protein